jgi:hypothetical protein
MGLGLWDYGIMEVRMWVVGGGWWMVGDDNNGAGPEREGRAREPDALSCGS